MNLNTFRSSFNNTEISRPSLFKVVLTPPPVMFISPENDVDQGVFVQSPLTSSQELSFRCKGASTPGRSIQTAEFSDYGPVRKIPIGAIYEPINLEFITSAKNTETQFFERWHEFIVSSLASHDLSYYDDIVSTMTISQYNTSNKEMTRYTLREAFPIAIQQTQLNWDDTNSYTKMVIQIYYREYEPAFLG